MPALCFVCDKGPQFGKSYTHHRGVAGGRWKKRAQKTNRKFVPNLQRYTAMLGKNEIRVKLCSKCLKRIRKDIAEGNKPTLILKQHIMQEKSKNKNTKITVENETDKKEKIAIDKIKKTKTENIKEDKTPKKTTKKKKNSTT